MLIFLYEYSCALADPALPASLRAEGRAMLAAVSEDFQQVPGVATCTLAPAASAEIEEAAFRRLAAEADFTLVIAPELDGLLLRRCRAVLDVGGRLLGPAPAAVQLTADKLALERYLTQRHIATPHTRLLSGPTGQPETEPAFPVVCKPRHGAGSQATVLVRDQVELADCAARARQEGIAGEMVLQPFVPGRAASVAFLVGHAACVPLLPAAQHLSGDGRFRYLGGQAPLPPALGERAERLAGRAVGAVVGLRAYVGVDLVLGAAKDASQDWVIEINPRLTTSYIGLRRLARVNLAEAMLRCAKGQALDKPTWAPGMVEFSADGDARVIDYTAEPRT
jgi:predicted ATP-grasp superfamily ATP-dependent carboligase